MVEIADLTEFTENTIVGYRLIHAKFPPINIFDDVANADDFDALYAIQALTNPRLQNEVGKLALVAREDIPFGITGCHYAAASFTQVNPDGSRFSDGSFGLMYVGDTADTAINEVRYHQQTYWQNVPNLHYERFVFKALKCTFEVNLGLDATHLLLSHPIYAPNDYSASRILGTEIRNNTAYSTLKYHSVRNPSGTCYALFTPKHVKEIIQTCHYEMIWSGNVIQSVNVVIKVDS